MRVVGQMMICFFCLSLCFLPARFACAAESQIADNNSDQYEELELFTDVLTLIKRNYVDKVSDKDLIYGGIRGMLATLDPHSSFLSPELYEDMQAETYGEFGGVGIEVTLVSGVLSVVTPLADTPASRAGIRSRDEILQIDGQSTQDLNLMEAVRLMRGDVGETIKLRIRRKGEKDQLTFSLVRELIHVQSADGRTLEPGYAYVRLTQFQERTAADLKKILSQLRMGNKDKLKGLILDLRNNPGGLLDQAVAVADLFLDQGLIVYTEGRDEGNQLRFNATKEGTEPPYPMIVLINAGSASASEIVAGALHDHQRGLLLGEKTFGKGSVQTIIPLSDNSGLRLTTARYYTPDGTSIQARGIVPDIQVQDLQLSRQKSKGSYREKDLKHHIVTPQMVDKKAPEKGLELKDKQDYQLMRALDLLKGLALFQHGNRSAGTAQKTN